MEKVSYWLIACSCPRAPPARERCSIFPSVRCTPRFYWRLEPNLSHVSVGIGMQAPMLMMPTVKRLVRGVIKRRRGRMCSRSLGRSSDSFDGARRTYELHAIARHSTVLYFVFGAYRARVLCRNPTLLKGSESRNPGTIGGS